MLSSCTFYLSVILPALLHVCSSFLQLFRVYVANLCAKIGRFHSAKRAWSKEFAGDFAPRPPSLPDVPGATAPEMFLPRTAPAFERSFRDFNYLIYTTFNSQSTIFPPKTVRHRDYSKCSEVEFSIELSSNLAKENPDSIDSFAKLFEKALNKHAPLKTVAIRGNGKPHMPKPLGKAIMLRTRLKSSSIKTRNNLDIQRYCHQRNLVVKLSKGAKREYYGNLDMRAAKDIRSFWKKFKPLFLNTLINEKIALMENGRSIKDDKEIS